MRTIVILIFLAAIGALYGVAHSAAHAYDAALHAAPPAVLYHHIQTF